MVHIVGWQTNAMTASVGFHTPSFSGHHPSNEHAFLAARPARTLVRPSTHWRRVFFVTPFPLPVPDRSFIGVYFSRVGVQYRYPVF